MSQKPFNANAPKAREETGLYVLVPQLQNMNVASRLEAIDELNAEIMDWQQEQSKGLARNMEFDTEIFDGNRYATLTCTPADKKLFETVFPAMEARPVTPYMKNYNTLEPAVAGPSPTP